MVLTLLFLFCDKFFGFSKNGKIWHFFLSLSSVNLTNFAKKNWYYKIVGGGGGGGGQIVFFIMYNLDKHQFGKSEIRQKKFNYIS
jgi:hypothetical protein